MAWFSEAPYIPNPTAYWRNFGQLEESVPLLLYGEIIDLIDIIHLLFQLRVHCPPHNQFLSHISARSSRHYCLMGTL